MTSSSRPPSPSRPPPRPGTYRVRCLSDVVSETVFEGYLTSEVFAAADAEYWRVVGSMRALPYAVMDGTVITGFDRAIASSAAPALDLFRERGGQEYLMVTTSAPFRMLGSALAASCRVSIRFFDTRASAFERLRQLGAW